MIDVNAIQETAREAERLALAVRKTEDGREYTYDVKGNLLWLTSKVEAPQFIRGNAVFSEAASLAAYVARFRETSSPIMVALAGEKVVKVTLDYPTSAGPTRNAHVAHWQLTESLEFKTWSSVAGKPMTQEAFMRFLEENTAEIVSPDPAKILELVSDFEEIKTVTFKSSRRLQNGLRELVYTEKDGSGAGGRAALPEKIELEMPVFRGEGLFEITALLRYRIDDGALKLWFDLHRVATVYDRAFTDAALSVAKQLQLEPMFAP